MSAYDPARPDGTNPTGSSPISPTGRADPGADYTVPARQGRAVRLRAGEALTVVNPTGHQVCDLFALVADAPAEYLSMEHCRTALGRIVVREGDALVTNRRRALLRLELDSSPGVHDTLVAACDWPRYRELGCMAYHDNCADNFRMSLAAIGVRPVAVPSPLNLWMNVPLDADGGFDWAAPTSGPRDHVRLRALLDGIVVLSACPQDITAVNGEGTAPAELVFRVDPGT